MNKIVPWYLLAMNYLLPVYLLIGCILLVKAPTLTVAAAILVAWLYLILPLACRLYLLLRGKPEGDVYDDSSVFASWWFVSQLQILYSRLPLLEELLRIVPGLYSLWLRLWGARVSLLVFWSPGVQVFDRYHLSIGAGVLIGGGCRVGGHAAVRAKDGRMHLIVGPVLIDQGATIGMNAAVGPGAHVYANETVPAGKLLKPFSQWRDGRLLRPPQATAQPATAVGTSARDSE